MEVNELNVTIIGFGAMGKGITELVNRKNCRIVGIVDPDPNMVGKRASEFINVKKENDLIIQPDIKNLQHVDGSVACITIGSFLKDIKPIIFDAIDAGMHVITIAEEMFYPKVTDPELADLIDEKAREKGVSVLGTGINPGFVFDLLIMTLSNVCQEVKSVKATRINDLSPFGPTALRTQGIGLTVEQFEEGLKDNSIVGHIGFPHSITMIAEAFGWQIDEIIETREPIIAKVKRELPFMTIEPGMVVGCNHVAVAKSGGKTVIEFEHPQQVFPELEGIETRDEIIFQGKPNIKLEINPEISGGIGTVAMVVNMIPLVLDAKAGIVTVRDLPRLPSMFPMKQTSKVK